MDRSMEMCWGVPDSHFRPGKNLYPPKLRGKTYTPLNRREKSYTPLNRREKTYTTRKREVPFLLIIKSQKQLICILCSFISDLNTFLVFYY